MSKIAVVYWSGTGNTESMAAMVAAGAKEAGAEVDLLTAAEFGPDQMDQYDAIAFGCPSMGAEQLEEGEFEPMFSACEAKLSARSWDCLVPMAGGTESGCAPGRRPARATAPTWWARASSATRPPTARRRRPARLWESPWPDRRQKASFAFQDTGKPLSSCKAAPAWGVKKREGNSGTKVFVCGIDKRERA